MRLLKLSDLPGGTLCANCAECLDKTPISGEVFSTQLMNGETLYYHPECKVRMVIGSVGHQLGVCSCHPLRPTVEDPLGLTPRQSALLALLVCKFRTENLEDTPRILH